MRYENFVLHIGSKRGEAYSVQVLESPTGEGSGKFEPPLTRAEIGSFFGQVRNLDLTEEGEMLHSLFRQTVSCGSQRQQGARGSKRGISVGGAGIFPKAKQLKRPKRPALRGRQKTRPFRNTWHLDGNKKNPTRAELATFLTSKP